MTGHEPERRNIGAVILAGGKGSRMGGADKGRLMFHGRSFLDRILGQLDGFSEILLAVDTPERYAEYPYPRIVDDMPGQGPMRGLARALATCRSDALLAVAVDMPLFERGVAEYLTAFFHPGCGAVAALDREGRRHPLCAIYAKRAAPVLLHLMHSGERRLRTALDLLEARDAPLAHSIYPDTVLSNINTAAELAALDRTCREESGPCAAPCAPSCSTEDSVPPLLAICGIKNSGKTTLLRRLIPLLRRSGLRIGVIKHDGHDFVPDVPGTDSFMLREAGAEQVAVYSAARFMLTGEGSGHDIASLLPRFRHLDLVLVEGCKRSALPKIEILRAHQAGQIGQAGQGAVSSASPEGLLAVCTDAAPGPDIPAGLPRFGLEDYDGLCRFILGYIGKGEPHA